MTGVALHTVVLVDETYCERVKGSGSACALRGTKIVTVPAASSAKPAPVARTLRLFLMMFPNRWRADDSWFSSIHIADKKYIGRCQWVVAMSSLNAWVGVG